MKVPFCPNHECRLHGGASLRHRRPWYQRYGSYRSACRGSIQRFRCRNCGRLFSRQSFSISYYEKRKVDLRALVWRLCSGEPLRAIGRSL